MSLPVVYLPAARDDIDDIYVQYEQQRAGLGARFVSALQDRIAGIQTNPGSNAVVYQDVRAASLRKFPYVVFLPC